VQTNGLSQTVAPVYPVPPHCPYSVCAGPEDVVVEDVLVVVEIELELNDEEEVVVVVPVPEELELTPVPDPTLVVMGPSSMYTPDT